jgi:hypothetical protein
LDRAKHLSHAAHARRQGPREPCPGHALPLRLPGIEQAQQLQSAADAAARSAARMLVSATLSTCLVE